MKPGFENVMAVIVSSSTINFIKSRGLIHRQFKKILDEWKRHRWLNFLHRSEVAYHGLTLKRFLNLITEIEIFMTEKNKSVTEISSHYWVCNLAFLVDITYHLNTLNTRFRYSILRNQPKLNLFKTQLISVNYAHYLNYKKVFLQSSMSNAQVYIFRKH